MAPHPARQRADARGPQADAQGRRLRCWPSRRRATRSTRCSTGRERRTGQGRGADGRPRQERPAAPDGLPDHDDEPAELVRRHQGRAARVAAGGLGRRGRAAAAKDRSADRSLVLRAPDGSRTPDRRARRARPRRPSARSTSAASGRSARHSGLRSVAEKAGIAPRPRRRRGRRRAGLQPGRSARERPAAGRGICPNGRRSLAAGLAVRPIWYYLLASALMLTCWEWFLYQRRWID